ncbi:MAG: TetR family transcriptional regulator [Burkholderiaceae bacterium]
MRKGEQTRAAILDAALELASRDGLEGLTIGLIAERMHMSKSGVFAHFGSREDLQIAVIQDYHRRFEEEVFLPSLKEPRGLPRLSAMYAGWVARHTREIDSGCMYISGAVEYDDRPGPIRDELLSMVMDWQKALLRGARQAVREGHLAADTDCEQLVFEMRAMVLGLHHDARFVGDRNAVVRIERGYIRLIDSYRNRASSIETGRRLAVADPAQIAN